MIIFDEKEIKIIVRELFSKGTWRSSRLIQQAIMESNHGKGGKSIPISSCVNSKGVPRSPILKDFLLNLDHSIYVDFFTESERGKKILSKLDDSIKGKIVVFTLNKEM